MAGFNLLEMPHGRIHMDSGSDTALLLPVFLIGNILFNEMIHCVKLCRTTQPHLRSQEGNTRHVAGVIEEIRFTIRLVVYGTS
jgi:hypothetical protein